MAGVSLSNVSQILRCYAAYVYCPIPLKIYNDNILSLMLPGVGMEYTTYVHLLCECVLSQVMCKQSVCVCKAGDGLAQHVHKVVFPISSLHMFPLLLRLFMALHQYARWCSILWYT